MGRGVWNEVGMKNPERNEMREKTEIKCYTAINLLAATSDWFRRRTSVHLKEIWN